MSSCISPITVKHPADPKVLNHVPCGKCIYCLNSRRNDWSFRLWQEQKHAKSSWFITLTYDDNNVPLSDYHVQTLKKEDLQKWIKRIRKRNHTYLEKNNYDIQQWQLRYYAVGEYGTRTERPHYHIILFNLHKDVLGKALNSWKDGFCQIGPVNSASIRYTTKYVINKSAEDTSHISKDVRDPGFAIMSRRPAIGHQYLKTIEYHRGNWQLHVKNENGVIQPLPRYYKDKFFSKDEIKYLTDEYKEISDEKFIRAYNQALDENTTLDIRTKEVHEVLVHNFNKRNKKNTF